MPMCLAVILSRKNVVPWEKRLVPPSALTTAKVLFLKVTTLYQYAAEVLYVYFHFITWIIKSQV